jgi:hypothetical protein
MSAEVHMLTYVIFILFLAIVTGAIAIAIMGTLAPVIFSVTLALFLGSGFAYMRERYRGPRR